MAHILVIDDEWEILDFVVDNLRAKGHDVLGLNNTAIASEVVGLSCNQFDLILCDVMMPKQNGLEFARNFLKQPNSRATTFALMSSYSNELKNEILDLGIKHSLHKPFTQPQLDEFIEKIVTFKKKAT